MTKSSLNRNRPKKMPFKPSSLLNRTYRGRQLYGPILCYGWKGNNIQPMSKDVQAEMLDRLKDTEVRV